MFTCSSSKVMASFIWLIHCFGHSKVFPPETKDVHENFNISLDYCFFSSWNCATQKNTKNWFSRPSRSKVLQNAPRAALGYHLSLRSLFCLFLSDSLQLDLNLLKRK